MADCPATHPRCQHTRDHDIRRYGCTCPAAYAARTRQQKQRRLRAARGQRLLLDATGTRRRIQALHALGWRGQDLARHLGWSQQGITQLLTDRQFVTPMTADAVRRVYDELWDQDGPSDITRARARAQGWPVPLAWDDDLIDDPSHTPSGHRDARPASTDVDEIAVEQACAGTRPAAVLTVAEREEAVQRLNGRGLSDHAIAETLRLTPRSVLRIRGRMQLPAAVAA